MVSFPFLFFSLSETHIAPTQPNKRWKTMCTINIWKTFSFWLFNFRRIVCCLPARSTGWLFECFTLLNDSLVDSLDRLLVWLTDCGCSWCVGLLVGCYRTGFRYTTQHRSIACLPRRQGHKAAGKHHWRPTRLSLSIRGDLHTLRHREQSGVRALHTGLQFPWRGK